MAAWYMRFASESACPYPGDAPAIVRTEMIRAAAWRWYDRRRGLAVSLASMAMWQQFGGLGSPKVLLARNYGRLWENILRWTDTDCVEMEKWLRTPLPLPARTWGRAEGKTMKKDKYWCCLAEEVAGLDGGGLAAAFSASATMVEAEDADTAAEKFAASTASCPGDGTTVDVAVALDERGAELGRIRVEFSLHLHTRTTEIP